MALSSSLSSCLAQLSSSTGLLRLQRLAPEFSSNFPLLGLDVIPNFVTDIEGRAMVEELQPRLRKLDYLSTHWDQVITGYREFQFWPEREADRYPACARAAGRLKSAFFPPEHKVLGTHVLDYTPQGHVRPHVDSTEFAGPILSGLSLISPVVMRFRHKHSDTVVDALIPANSVYLMHQCVRHEFTHETPPPTDDFGDRLYGHPRSGRRIAFILRSDASEPSDIISPWAAIIH